MRDFVVEIGNLFDQIVIGLVDEIDIFLRHIGHLIRRAKLVAVRINNCLLINNVELAFELIFLAERQQNRPCIRAELVVNAVDRHLEVSADAIHLINKRDRGTLYFVA